MAEIEGEARQFLDGAAPEPTTLPAVMGRPRQYTGAQMVAICDRIANGELLVNVLKEDGMPSNATFSRWRAAYPDLSAIYTEAKVSRTDLWGDEIITIVDDKEGDYQIDVGDDKTAPTLVAMPNLVSRSALQAKYRFMLMGKHDREQYGDTPAAKGHPGDDAKLIGSNRGPLLLENDPARESFAALEETRLELVAARKKLQQ